MKGVMSSANLFDYSKYFKFDSESRSGHVRCYQFVMSFIIPSLDIILQDQIILPNIKSGPSLHSSTGTILYNFC